jgi:hypothetical protein
VIPAPEIVSAPLLAAAEHGGRSGLTGALVAGAASLPWLIAEGEVALTAERIIRAIRRVCRRCVRPAPPVRRPYDWKEEA